MTKFAGKIGYGVSTLVSPGVWEDVIVEYPYFGNVVRNSRGVRETEKVNNDLTVGNSISIIADAYARNHFHAMRYIEWAGTLWIVDDVVVESPRLLIRLGGVYNGPKAPAPDPSE